MSEESPCKRIRLSEDDAGNLNKPDMLDVIKKQEDYITELETKLDFASSGSSGGEGEEKARQLKAARREQLLVMRLTTKEQELHELANQLADKNQNASTSQLRAALVDPALNLLVQRLKKELEDKTKSLQQAHEDMAAWKFTPDSQTGKRLMARCRTLIQENQELGKQVSQGKVAQVEAELSLQKEINEELKSSQDEMYEMVIQLNDEGEGMQSTILALQQELKEKQQEIARIQCGGDTVGTLLSSPSAADTAFTHEPGNDVPMEEDSQPDTQQGYVDPEISDAVERSEPSPEPMDQSATAVFDEGNTPLPAVRTTECDEVESAPVPAEEALQDEIPISSSNKDSLSIEPWTNQSHFVESPASPVGEGERAASPVGDVERTASPVREDEWTASPVREDEWTASPVREDERTTSPVREDERAASPFGEDERTPSPVREDERIASPVREDERTASPVREDERTASPVGEDERTSEGAFEEAWEEEPYFRTRASKSPSEEPEYAKEKDVPQGSFGDSPERTTDLTMQEMKDDASEKEDGRDEERVYREEPQEEHEEEREEDHEDIKEELQFRTPPDDSSQSSTQSGGVRDVESDNSSRTDDRSRNLTTDISTNGENHPESATIAASSNGEAQRLHLNSDYGREGDDLDCSNNKNIINTLVEDPSTFESVVEDESNSLDNGSDMTDRNSEDTIIDNNNGLSNPEQCMNSGVSSPLEDEVPPVEDSDLMRTDPVIKPMNSNSHQENPLVEEGSESELCDGEEDTVIQNSVPSTNSNQEEISV